MPFRVLAIVAQYYDLTLNDCLLKYQSLVIVKSAYEDTDSLYTCYSKVLL